MISSFEKLLDKLNKSGNKYDIDKITKAYNLADEAHGQQIRKSGTPYITHPLAVAGNVVDMQLDTDSVCAALLHDVVEDTEYTTQYIKDNFGYEMDLFRYPAGKFSEQSLAVINNCGYKSIFWSFAYMDYDVENQPDEEESLEKMTERLHPGAVYLLHAESKTNAAVLGDFIDAAREQGYTFKVI